MEVWRINLRERKYQRQPVPHNWNNLGGRGLVARIMVDEVVPTCEPLGPFNKLIFTPGLLTGHMLSSCDRLSVGGKSPLTGGIKEANAGGTTGLKMAHLGIKALILEEAHPTDEWVVIFINKEGVRFDKATGLIGLGVYECTKLLFERYGDKIAISLIGPGGEMLLAAAGIQNLDKDKVPSRIAARGGLGAVMGSKKVKAIIFDASEGEKPAINDEPSFRSAQKRYTKALIAHPQIKLYADYGTNAMPSLSHPLGAMPTRNFSSGQFEGVHLIDGEHMRDVILERGGEGKTTHSCMPGCTIQCSNVFADKDGKTLVSSLEYETIGLIGSNLGISDLDTIARLNYVINDLGLDSIEIGAALGISAEAGLMEFGDGERAMQLLGEIQKGTPFGRILGNGAAITGKIFAVENVPVVKNQAMSAYEPRVIKGTGVTYATSPQGADHTAGLTIRAKVDHLDPTLQVDVSRKAQINMAGYDTLGACIFASFAFGTMPETIKELLTARYGYPVDDEILQILGKETITLEREFNRRAGFTQEDDRIPEWMTRKPVPPQNSVFDVPNNDLDKIFDW